jgi:hypothetical protein
MKEKSGNAFQDAIDHGAVIDEDQDIKRGIWGRAVKQLVFHENRTADLQKLKSFTDRRLLVMLFCWLWIESRQGLPDDIYLHGSILTDLEGTRPPMLK